MATSKQIIDTLFVRISKSVPKQHRPHIEFRAIKEASNKYEFQRVEVILV